jgi:hypothetical protein
MEGRISETFEQAVASYMEWARKTEVKESARSQDLWKIREQMLNEHVIPLLGD